MPTIYCRVNMFVMLQYFEGLFSGEKLQRFYKHEEFDKKLLEVQYLSFLNRLGGWGGSGTKNNIIELTPNMPSLQICDYFI